MANEPRVQIIPRDEAERMRAEEALSDEERELLRRFRERNAPRAAAPAPKAERPASRKRKRMTESELDEWIAANEEKQAIAREYINSAPTGGQKVIRQVETVAETIWDMFTSEKTTPLDLLGDDE